MKKNLFVGVDFIGDEEIRVNNDIKQRSRWDAFLEKFGSFLGKISLLGKDIKFIEARYDKAITNFFIFTRFIFTFNVITFFGFLYLLIYHVIDY
jgi:hypothetical protein